MRILVVGSGGREHALAWKLAQDAEVFCAPGNPGMAQVAECFPIAASDHEGIVALAQSVEANLVVIGPEDPLVAGLADRLRGAGLIVFGPGAEGARLEASKAFSKALMVDAGVRTARFQSFTDPGSAIDHAEILLHDAGGVVVKASGNALGKGVILCGNDREVREAIDAMMVEQEFGDAGLEVVVEEQLRGAEFSLLTLCSDHDILSLPIAQDYKRALDGDRGPNTGGMGSVSPVGWVSHEMIEEAEANAVRPILARLHEHGIPYRGLLFSGFLVNDRQPYCLEYNVRFGDPETQSVLLRLGSGLGAALTACAHGEAIPPVEVLTNAAVTVVVASGGYPGAYEKGLPITVGEMGHDVHVFHAGTRTDSSGTLVTSGGRVAAVSASADSVMEARTKAYRGASKITFAGAQYRSDIASV